MKNPRKVEKQKMMMMNKININKQINKIQETRMIEIENEVENNHK